MQSDHKENPKKFYSLLELTRSIESVIKKTYTASYWVKAEIAKLNYYPQSGHCYPDLVEKENGVVLAQIRSTIWAGNFSSLNSKFVSITKEPLSDGMTVLIRVTISFHPVYGLTLQIVDVEPTYTLGELAKEKQQSIDRLKKEGVIDKNKHLVPPLLFKRLAIISVETSKGYHDFLKVIDQNEWGYNFFHMLFPAILQGIGAVNSIIEQLNRIKKVLKHFDAVLIIRGGGGDVGLSSFDNFKIANAVANFPLPIITGIGHATNETVVEQVAFINKITPTEVGYYLLQRFHDFSVQIQRMQNIIIDKSNQILANENRRLYYTISGLKSNIDGLVFEHRNILNQSGYRVLKSADKMISNNKRSLHALQSEMSSSVTRIFEKSNYNIISVSDKLRLLDPKNILKRGFSITTKNGKAIFDSDKVSCNDEIETIVFSGRIISKVEKINN